LACIDGTIKFVEKNAVKMWLILHVTFVNVLIFKI